MNKPVYEIPIGDGESWPAAPARRSTAPSMDVTPGNFDDTAPPTQVFDLSGTSAGGYVPHTQAAPSFEEYIQAQQAAAPPIPLPTQPAPAQPTFTPPVESAAPPVAPAAASDFSGYAAPAPAYASAPPPTLPPLPSQAPPSSTPPARPTVRTAPSHALELDTAPSIPTPAGVKPLASDTAPAPGLGQAGSDPDLVAALNAVVNARASDLHVTVNAPPMVRVDGGLRPVPDLEPWDTEKVTAALHSIMSEKHREIFEEKLELDFAYTLSESARFRVNIYQQRNVIGAAFRLIPTEIKQLAALGVPEKIGKFAQLPRGLVLVTGPTGSGKSTTLAALIDLANATRADHIVTVEDPIEFMHTNKKSLVNQREVGADTHSFANALKHVLRQDPDIILIGELRDLETISVALTAAETGHLVFATLHTQDAAQTIDRVIDVFPPHQQGQVRAQLAATLQGVVCQTLVKKVHGGGRAVATEVLIMTSAVSNLIREGKTYQIHSAMQAGRDLGMHTMDQHLADLVNAGQISHQAAYDKAHDVDDLKQLIQRAGGEAGTVSASVGQSASIDFGDSFSTKGV